MISRIEDDVTTWLFGIAATSCVINLVRIWKFRGRDAWVALRLAIAYFVAGTGILWTTAVLFGAPAQKSVTLLWATMQSSVTTLPLAFRHKGSPLWIFALTPELWFKGDELQVAGTSSLLGAWAGSVVVPLDWGEKWQLWPCSHIYGAIAGWALGLLGSLVTCSVSRLRPKPHLT